MWGYKKLKAIHVAGTGKLGVARPDRLKALRSELDEAYAEAMEPYKLFWYEEAGDPLDYALQAALSEFYPGPMATGENLFSHQDARNLLRYGGMRSDRDWLQFDCALSYGLVEYLRTLDVLAQFGWSPSRCRRCARTSRARPRTTS